MAGGLERNFRYQWTGSRSIETSTDLGENRSYGGDPDESLSVSSMLCKEVSVW